MAATYSVKLEMPDGVQTIVCDGEQSVMEAAQAAGVEIPSLCHSGACSTCASQVVEGTVNQTAQTSLDEEQRARGLVLPCVTYPTSDCIIATHKEHALYTPGVGVRGCGPVSRVLCRLLGLHVNNLSVSTFRTPVSDHCQCSVSHSPRIF